MNLLGSVPWLKLVACGALFALGLYVGAHWVQGRWNADRLAQAQAVARMQADNLAKEQAYERQLSTAASQHDADLALLARIRAAPVHGIVCHSTASGNAVPSVPAASGGQVATGGELSPTASAEFDPTPALTALADRADDTVEACRDALAKWPR